MDLIIIIVVLLLIFGGLGFHPISRGYVYSGYRPGIGIGTILLIILICWLVGIR
jgi:hypothetical protein